MWRQPGLELIEGDRPGPLDVDPHVVVAGRPPLPLFDPVILGAGGEPGHQQGGDRQAGEEPVGHTSGTSKPGAAAEGLEYRTVGEFDRVRSRHGVKWRAAG